ncbi:hypothetical protein [Paraburkholderia humisilvae]|uniref:hypothetical protein n=1 Tax=Paraburkholderia humisilvae TaxID=627669 RepID=UPI001FE5A0C5|nr:hypothetical protein [Paraburkholderia humisilvae]
MATDSMFLCHPVPDIIDTMIASEIFFMGLLDTTSNCREGYHSIFHYWESEKWRGVDEHVRQDILAVPTIRELRKMLKRVPDTWRSDWKQVRGRVFRSALLYAIDGHPDLLQELVEPFDLMDACHKWGIPAAFVKYELVAVRREIDEPFRLLALGSEAAPATHVQATLGRLIGNRQDCQYVAFAGRKMDMGLHRWAAEKLFPMHYVGTNSNKGLDQDAVQQLISRSTHVVVFTREGTSPDEQIVRLARSQGRTIRVSQYAAQRSGTNSTAAGARSGGTTGAAPPVTTTQRRSLRAV